MQWMKRNQYGLLVTAFSVLVLAVLLPQATPPRDVPAELIDPFFEQVGRWAVRMLLLCLAMTPLHRVFGWRAALKLRKPLGLWAFAFAAIHFADYLGLSPNNPQYGLTWPETLTQPYILLGVVALVVLALLAVTSNQWAMRRLKKWWKRLHRLVYAAAVLGVVHGIIAAANGKKAFFRDEIYINELKLYLAVLVVLLAFRIPLVHRAARHVRLSLTNALRSRTRRKVNVPPVSVIEHYIEESDLMETEAEPAVMHDQG